MKQSKRTSRKQAHTPKSPKGMGDHYGSGVRNPIGKMVRSYMDTPMTSKNQGKPPKALA